MTSTPGPPGGWQARPSGAPYGARGGRGLAIAALVLGILACVLFWTVIGGVLLGLVAIVLGIVTLARRGEGRGLAITGIVLGLVGLVVSGIIVAIGASILNSEEFDSFEDCLRAADTDAQRDDCAREFNRDLQR